ncbi:MAG: hypothetical protein RIB61_09090 [Roseicyclus sp.]
MRKLIALVLVVMAALPARAEVEIGFYDQITTRFGTVEVRGGWGGERLYWNGQQIPGLDQGVLSIAGAWGRAEEAFDWVLVTHFAGGNACDPPFHAIMVSAQGVAVSPPMGGCVWPLLDLRVGPGRIAVDLPHPDLAIDRQTYEWDGATLTQALVRQAPAARVPGAGPDVTRWIGTHPHDVFADPGERARLATVMPETRIAELATSVSVANPATRAGDWVIGQGCYPHACNLQRGLWALRISDGAVGAAILYRDRPADLYGFAQFDPTLSAAIAAHRP